MHLDVELSKYINKSKDKDRLLALLNGKSDYVSVPPFTPAVEILIHLVNEKIISLNTYKDFRKKYQKENYNLTYFLLGPRSFGEGTIEPNIINSDKRWKSAHNDSKNTEANGSFDAYVIDDNHKIKVEFKATRATFEKKGKKDLRGIFDRAMYLGDEINSSKEGYDWNYQQIKPAMTDIFVLIATFIDGNRYWVMSSQEILDNPEFSDKQHRGNSGEGQLHFKKKNITNFDPYIVKEENLVDYIIDKYDKRV